MFEMQQMAELYFKHGIQFFELSKYSLALDMWKKCFELHEKEDEIIDILENCFILPNLSEFKENYKKQCEMLPVVLQGKVPIYEELKLEVIFVQENIWYVLDKREKELYGPVNLSKEYYQKDSEIHLEDEFSDIILKSRNFLSCIKIIANIEERKVYNLIENLEEWFSFLKIPGIVEELLSNMIITDSIEKLFQYFHENTQIYLPREGCLFEEEEYSYIEHKLEEEHSYRITGNGRDTSNILLSICIPSYNRGTYALQNIKELLDMSYDNEVEIIVSNNGSTYDIEGYKEIANQRDNRIVYFEFVENQHFVGNFWKVLELAKGKYALILSDEDRLVLSALPHYFQLMKKNSTLGVIRSNNFADINSYSFMSASYEKAGKEALKSYFMVGNYVSGIIYKTEMITRDFIKNFTEMNKDNLCFSLYPHMCLDAVLLLKYDFCKDNEILFINGKPIEEKEAIDGEIDNTTKFPEYSKIQNRLLQHYDWIKLLNQLSINDKVKYILYVTVCNNLFALVNAVKIMYEEDWENICLQMREACVQGYDKLETNSKHKIIVKEEIVQFINSIYTVYK